MPSDKQVTTIRLSPEAFAMLDYVGDRLGLCQNAVIEMAVRKQAYTEGFLDSDTEEARHYREARQKRRDQRRSRRKEKTFRLIMFRQYACVRREPTEGHSGKTTPCILSCRTTNLSGRPSSPTVA